MKCNARKLVKLTGGLFVLIMVLYACGTKSTKSGQTSEKKVPLTCIGSDASSEKQKQLEQGIRKQIKFAGEEEKLASIAEKLVSYQIPALSLALINKGQLEWTAVYTNPNFANEKDLNCTSIFQAASLSKPVTFMAAWRMQAVGVIDFDENIQHYLHHYILPEGRQTDEHPVTFRNIFSHTSGISSGGYEGYDQSFEMPTDEAILSGAEGVHTPAIEVVSTPDEVLAYSGGAYTLAELALQDHLGESFATLMKTWILNPLHMNHSEFTQPLQPTDSQSVANAYTQNGQMVSGGWHNYPQQAAAGLWTTAHDLAKFMIEIYNAYHGKSTVFTRQDMETILSHEREGLVFGFIINHDGDEITLTHYGGNTGYRSGMTINLESGKGLVYLTNSDNGVSLGNELLMSAAQVYGWPHFRQEVVQRKTVGSAVLKELAGNYLWNEQIALSITNDENAEQLTLHFPNGDAYEMVAIEGDELQFINENTGVRISFSAADSFKNFTLYGQSAVRL